MLSLTTTDSLLCAFKLRKIGAKRVRGYRQLEKQRFNV